MTKKTDDPTNEAEMLEQKRRLFAATCSVEKRRSDAEAWELVKKISGEWTYEDWSDFYEGITGALKKIVARRKPQNDKVSNSPEAAATTKEKK